MGFGGSELEVLGLGFRVPTTRNPFLGVFKIRMRYDI